MKFSKKTKISSEIPTASMPDIIFMLLVFFMVTTVLKEYSGLPVNLPKAKRIEKLKSNLKEVEARGGELIVFTEDEESFTDQPSTTIIKMPEAHHILSPVVYVLPLQLLSYYVAVYKGTDVDQPRNLAKSVTVE